MVFQTVERAFFEGEIKSGLAFCHFMVNRKGVTQY